MNNILTLLTLLLLFSCNDRVASEQEPPPPDRTYIDPVDTPGDTLFRTPGDSYMLGEPFAYVNQRGDTIVPLGSFAVSFTDTIISFGIVLEDEGQPELIAINPRGERLYEVYLYDNGPDYLSEGLFRILRNEKIGYADADGRIVIPPQYACAHPFAGGRAQVALDCVLVDDGEHQRMRSDNWFYIDKQGRKM